MMKVPRRIQVLALIIAIASVWHFVWLGNYCVYLKDSDGYEKNRINYINSIGDYSLTLQCPRYPSFTGNYAIGNEAVGLIIWPGLFTRGNCEYGLELFSEEKNTSYRFYVDRNMNFLDISNNFSDDEKK